MLSKAPLPILLSLLLGIAGCWFCLSPNPFLRQIGMLYFGLGAGALVWANASFQKGFLALVERYSCTLPPSPSSQAIAIPTWESRLAWGISGAVIALFIATSLHYSVNIPFADDYVSFVGFIARLPTMSWYDIFDKIFLSHYMEHIIAGGYILVILSSLGTGQLNPTVLNVMGFGNLLLYLWLLRANIPKLPNISGALLLLPVVCMLFQLQYYLVVAWLTNFPGVIFFHVLVLASFHFVSRRQIAAAAACAVFATLSFGSGFLTLLMGFLILVLRNDFKGAIAWYFPMTFGLAMFFRAFRDPSAYPFYLGQFLKFTVAFLGSVTTFGIFGGPEIAVTLFAKAVAFVTGFLFLLLFGWLTLRRAYTRNTPIYSLLIFSILSALMAAKQRGYFGTQQVFQSRYHFYSALVAICLYILSLQCFGRVTRRWVWGIASITLAVNLISWQVGTTNLKRHSENLAFGYYLTKIRPVPPDPALRVESPEDIYLYAQREIPDEGSVHISPAEFYRVIGSARSQRTFPTSKATAEPQIDRPQIVRSRLFTEVRFDAPAGQTYYVSFADDKQIKVFDTSPINRRSVSWSLMRNFFPNASTVLALIPTPELASGKYDLRVQWENNGQPLYQDFGVVGLD